MQVFSSIKEAVAGVGVKRRASCSLLHHHQGSPVKDEPISINLADEKEPEEVDISQLTKEDLERLRFEDPFLYYSIPENKRRLFQSKSSSNSNHSESISFNSSRRSSCPTILLNRDAASSDGSQQQQQQQQQQQRRVSVTRVRRLSVEPHPDLIIKEIMEEMGEEFSDSDMDVDEEDEKLIQALKNGTFDLA